MKTEILDAIGEMDLNRATKVHAALAANALLAYFLF
jgi:hypothetical protein